MLFRNLFSLLLVVAVNANTTVRIKCAVAQGASSIQSIPTITQEYIETTTLSAVTVQETTYDTITTTEQGTTQTIESTTTVTTTVTDSTITDTFSTTSTEYTTETDTTTTTNAQTDYEETTTTTTVTSTIAAPSGFLPVQDTTATAYPQKRDLTYLLKRGGLDDVCKDQYPQSVNCRSIVEIEPTSTIYVPGETQSITETGTPVTTTILITSTSTSTEAPNVSVTSSFSTTITSTTTTTETEYTTTTSTLVTEETAQASPIYEACGPDNFIGPEYNSAGLYNVYNRGPGAGTEYTVDGTVNTAYDCCVACLLSEQCPGTVFIPSGASCLLLTGSSTTCASQSENPAYYVEDPNATGQYIVSNGPCGYLYDGGNGN